MLLRAAPTQLAPIGVMIPRSCVEFCSGVSARVDAVLCITGASASFVASLVSSMFLSSCVCTVTFAFGFLVSPVMIAVRLFLSGNVTTTFFVLGIYISSVHGTITLLYVGKFSSSAVCSATPTCNTIISFVMPSCLNRAINHVADHGNTVILAVSTAVCLYATTLKACLSPRF